MFHFVYDSLIIRNKDAKSLCFIISLQRFQHRPVEFIPDFFEEIKAASIEDVHRNLSDQYVNKQFYQVGSQIRQPPKGGWGTDFKKFFMTT